MSGFQFPPPPPPPPKPSGDDNGEVARSGRGQGRGRGRGGPDFRGREGRGRGQQSQSRGQPQGNYGPQNSSHHGNHSQGQHGIRSNTSQDVNTTSRYGMLPTSELPPGSYVNPAFHQNISTFGNNTGTSVANTSDRETLYSNGTQSSPQRTSAGRKRKLEALRGAPRDKQAGPPTAPSIPTFGNPIIATQNGRIHPHPAQSKRSSNMLGLTPQDDQPQYSSDSDDDDGVDEEAMYAELGTNLTFEHNGAVITLKTAADLAAWKEERHRNFPTKQRLIMKLEEKRQIGEERKRLLTEASQALRAAKEAKFQASASGVVTQEQAVSEPESELEKARRELAVQTARVNQLRRQVSKGEERLARARNEGQASEGIVTTNAKSPLTKNDKPTTVKQEDRVRTSQEGYEATVASTTLVAADLEVATVAEDAENVSTAVSPVSPTAAASDDSEDSEDDGPPEEATSARTGNTQKHMICKFFAASGSCRDGDMCTYNHVLDPRTAATMSQERQRKEFNRTTSAPDEQNDGPSSSRKTIWDRLVEQEQGQDDKLALQVIRYLGHKGLFAKKVEDEDAHSDGKEA